MRPVVSAQIFADGPGGSESSASVCIYDGILDLIWFSLLRSSVCIFSAAPSVRMSDGILDLHGFGCAPAKVATPAPLVADQSRASAAEHAVSPSEAC